VAVGAHRIAVDAERVALVVVTALKLALAVAVRLGGADIYHAQGTGLPDGIQAVLEAQGRIGQKFADLEIGEACPQLGKAVREQAALVGVGRM
jgi:hypothetical protein